MLRITREHNLLLRLARFRADEAGVITVEFVILFPALVMVILVMVWLSLLIATLSDVQQLASDLTRQSLRYGYLETDADALCTRLREEVEPTLVASLTFLDAANIVDVSCDIQSEIGASMVTVTYDLQRFVNTSIGRVIGWENSEIARFAVMVF